MKKGLFIGAAVVLLSHGGALAVPIFTDRTAWQNAVGVYVDVDLGGAPNHQTAGGTLADGSPLPLPPTFGTALRFDSPLDVQAGAGWDNYVNPGGGDPLILTTGVLSLMGTFSESVARFGFELFPAEFSNMTLGAPPPSPTRYITLTLSDGTQISQLVDGQGKPQFIGWIAPEGVDIDSISIETDQIGFSIGNFVVSEPVPVTVPDRGATLGLLGLALLGLATARFRFA